MGDYRRWKISCIRSATASSQGSPASSWQHANTILYNTNIFLLHAINIFGVYTRHWRPRPRVTRMNAWLSLHAVSSSHDQALNFASPWSLNVKTLYTIHIHTPNRDCREMFRWAMSSSDVEVSKVQWHIQNQNQRQLKMYKYKYIFSFPPEHRLWDDQMTVCPV